MNLFSHNRLHTSNWGFPKNSLKAELQTTVLSLKSELKRTPSFVVQTLVCIIFMFSSELFAQTDSTKTLSLTNGRGQASADSNLAVINPASSGLDAPVSYDARSIYTDFITQRSVLTGDAIVKYKEITIEAGRIFVDMPNKMLIAEAVAETLTTSQDSLALAELDSFEVHVVGHPVLIEGNERIVGDKMEFNFETQRGRIVRGRTKMEGGHFTGDAIKRVSEKVFNVRGGTFTTCDKEDSPHFHFWAQKMKLIEGERIIAKPIVLFFGQIPVLALPFGMFPTETGRRSGIIIPKYGQTSDEGRSLRDLGYYWAISDYMDARLTADFFEKSGWIMNGNFNYNWRYHFRGSISGSLTRKNFASTGRNQRTWNVRVNHSQEINKSSSFNVSANFVNDNSFLRTFSLDQDERLQREISSQATYTKRWKSLRSNMSLNLSETRDTESGRIVRSLPRLTFNFSERAIFARKKPGANQGYGLGGATSASASSNQKAKWYENIYFGFRTNAQSQFNRTPDTEIDSIFTEDTKSFASNDFNLRLNSPNKFFGWLSLNQRLAVDQDFFDRTQIYEDSTGLVSGEFDKGFFVRHLFNYALSGNTKLYGMFSPSIGPIKAVRHVVTPSISLNYQPDFSSERWGYFQNYVDANGDTLQGDRFANTGGSRTPSTQIAGMSFSVDNLFQMKTENKEGKEKKFNLFNVRFGSAYNFAAERKRLSNLSTSLSANPINNLSLSVNMSHSPYQFDDSTGVELDSYLWAGRSLLKGGFLRLTNLSITSRLTLKGKSTGGVEASTTEPPPYIDDYGGGFGNNFNRFEGGRQQSFASEGVSWRASFSLSYSLSKFNPLNPSKRANLNISNVDVGLTKNWRVQFRGNFDLQKLQMDGQNWSIRRELHCWEFSVNWTPTGAASGFYFRINAKAPQLRDLKYEKRSGRSTLFDRPF